ncbi:MAG TPA: 50S ribosomal protein L25 [Solirubrobacteraceae bacterium]|nr:50S ribosomal protein L25 [Solirubrobacteraceae bacterium]
MASTQGTALSVEVREPAGSRAARRLRRTGQVPGVVYGGGEDPISFAVDARLLRQTLAHAGAVIDLSIDGSTTPVVLKDLVRHPVTGDTVHVDLLRVRLDQTIQTSVVVELVGADDAPGVKEGGVLEQVTREVTIEALPNDIPDSIAHDVSAAQIGDTITLAALTMPSGVALIDDPETTLASLTPPRLQVEEEPEIEAETELVGEGETAEEAAQAAEAEAEQAPADGEGDSGGE